MFKAKADNGDNNISGKKIKQFRLAMKPKMSQNGLAVALQRVDLDVDKNAVQRMESGQRYITDIELKKIAKVLNVSYEDLLGR